MNLELFRSLVKGWMESESLTQEKAAKELKIPTLTLHRLLKQNGVGTGYLEAIVKVADKFQVSTDELLGRLQSDFSNSTEE